MSAVTEVRIGARLRHAREASRQSLSEVAARCGVSKGFISRIERDEASPSVASLVALCDAVGLSMADLFAAPETTLVRRADRPSLDGLPKSANVVDTLITPPRERHVTVLESTVAPSASAGEQLYTLPSECEVCFVLAGEVEIEVDGETFTLGPGDALTFGAAVPHTWRNASDAEGARILWILAPALPDPRKEAA
ncbi:MAG TPA: cupin domain-containing protein [Solirubrobacteraceae bacterium]|jgi:transcriptional regulator with XRE-family HTH domain